MQKKQNTRRSLAHSVHKIHCAGMFVSAGFILGFDSEKGSVADAMIACIDESAMPVSMVGLLYALPNTQLTRRLAAEGRLFPNVYMEAQATSGIGDQCTAGLNFSTARSRREILMDYKKVLQHIYSPAAYFGRVRRMALTLDRPVLNRGSSTKPPMRLGSIPLRDLGLLWRLVWRIALRQPRALWHFAGAFVACARRNPRSLEYVGITAALYLHLGPFSRFVMTSLKKQLVKSMLANGARHLATLNVPSTLRGFRPEQVSERYAPP